MLYDGPKTPLDAFPLLCSDKLTNKPGDTHSAQQRIVVFL